MTESFTQSLDFPIIAGNVTVLQLKGRVKVEILIERRKRSNKPLIALIHSPGFCKVDED
jgi:hypothetical protein